MKTRIAPTPSGHLHIGNLVHFLVVKDLAKNGEILLRIDDFDSQRCGPEFVDNIFYWLQLLEISWHGPKDSQDFYQNYTQTKKTDLYWSYLLRLSAVYVCECSRKELGESNNCMQNCQKKKLTYREGHSCIRFKSSNLGDFVVWRRENLPAYHLVSVVEDELSRVDLIVRGKDLYQSTLQQQELAQDLNFTGFLAAKFIHHDLLQAADGQKLSKSRGDRLALDVDLSEVRQAAARILQKISRERA